MSGIYAALRQAVGDARALVVAVPHLKAPTHWAALTETQAAVVPADGR